MAVNRTVWLNVEGFGAELRLVVVDTDRTAQNWAAESAGLALLLLMDGLAVPFVEVTEVTAAPELAAVPVEAATMAHEPATFRFHPS